VTTGGMIPPHGSRNAFYIPGSARPTRLRDRSMLYWPSPKKGPMRPEGFAWAFA